MGVDKRAVPHEFWYPWFIFSDPGCHSLSKYSGLDDKLYHHPLIIGDPQFDDEIEEGSGISMVGKAWHWVTCLLLQKAWENWLEDNQSPKFSGILSELKQRGESRVSWYLFVLR
jgi:hypothetical protein